MTGLLLLSGLATAGEPNETNVEYAAGYGDGVAYWEEFNIWTTTNLKKDGTRPLRMPYWSGLAAGAVCSGVGCLVNGAVWYYVPTPIPEGLPLTGSPEYYAGWEAGYLEEGQKKRYRVALLGGALGTVIASSLIVIIAVN